MGDSDDDYESSMNRRGQSRNKFRNERDDLINNNNNPNTNGNMKDQNNDLKRKERDFNANNNFNRPNNMGNRRPNLNDNFNEFGYGRPYPNQNFRNRGPPPMDRGITYPTDRSLTPPNNMNRHGNFVPQGEYNNRYHDDEFKMMGFNNNKRHNPSSPPGGYQHHGSQMMPFYYDRNSPGFYDNHPHPPPPHSSAKKQRRDWSMLEGPPQSSHYFEHDNRAGDYDDEFIDEYNDDYNRLNRPPNYHHNYNNSNNNNINNNNNNSNNNRFDSYRHQNFSSNQSFYSSSSSSSSSNNYNQNGNNNMKNNNNFNPFAAAQVLMNSMVSQVAPILNANNNFKQNLNNNFETQPQMLTFKQFLHQINQENSTPNVSISNEIANKRYNDYKIQFRKEQVQSFFDAHKSEEWFKNRYHPIESHKRKDEQRESIKQRLSLFLAMLKKYEERSDFTITCEMNDDIKSRHNLLNLVEACMIKLENGSDLDIEKLDAYYEKLRSNVEEKVEESDEIKQLPHKTQSIFFKHLPVIVSRQDLEKIGLKHEGYLRASISEPAPERRFQRRGWITFASTVNIKETCAKINGTRLYDMQLNATVNREGDQKIKLISGLSNHKDIVRNDLKLICKVVENMDKRWGLWQHKYVTYEEKCPNDGNVLEERIKADSEHKNSIEEDELTKMEDSLNEKNDTEEVVSNKKEENTNNNKQEENKNGHSLPVTIEDNNDAEKNPLLLEALEYLSKLDEIIEKEKQIEEEENKKIEETETKKQEENDEELKSTTPKQENETEEQKLELEIKNEEGVVKKEEQEDLSEKIEIQSVVEEGVVVSTTIDDLGLKENNENNKNENEETKTAEISSNKNEIETEKVKTVTSSATKIVKMEKDDRAAILLDKLILYLRLVHSMDYYNSSEYQQEDYMPLKCGIIHLRGSSNSKNTSSNVNILNGVNVNYYDPLSIKKLQIDEWVRLFDLHIKPYSEYREHVDIEVAKRLGLKETKEEVEKFIQSNCQQIDKNIWLCPLSGKKFKGPDYVKKHIETKHAERLTDVEKEVEYFNKFVMDPKRPYLPDHPKNNPQQQNQMNNQNNNANQMMMMIMQQQQQQQRQQQFAPMNQNYNNYNNSYHSNDYFNNNSNNYQRYPKNNFTPSSHFDNYHHHNNNRPMNARGGPGAGYHDQPNFHKMNKRF